MAECVSCGREIAPGKLFCDECYVKMKGRMGPRRKPEPASEAGNVASPHYRSTSPAAGGERPQGNITVLGEAGVARAGGVRSELTPVSQKKVVSLKPRVEAAAKEKARSAKKFTITVTFSDKTYERLARMRERLKREGKKREKEVSGEVAPGDARPAGKKRRKGPYGRPVLKAVESHGAYEAAQGRGFKAWLLYRRRPWDRGDRFALAAATCATAMVLAFSFMEWVRVHWVSQAGSTLQVVGVKGMELGAFVYVAMAMAVLAWCYMTAVALLGGERLRVDFGVALLLAGLVIIPMVFLALSDNAGVYSAAMQVMQRKGASVPIEAAGYERHTSWPAYLMVLAGLTLSFSGLVRLSERRSKASVVGKAGAEREGD